MTERTFDELPALLEKARRRLLAPLEDLPEEALHFRPGPEEWSVLEVLEHVWRTERLYALNGRQLLGQLPPGTPSHFDSTPAALAAGVTGPNVSAPSFALPEGGYDLPTLRTRLAGSRRRVLTLWEALRERDSAAVTYEVPEIGFIFNAGQMIHMAGLHDRFHGRQVRNNISAWRAQA